MREEEKIFAGQLFCPGDPDLKAIKLRSHELCSRYNTLYESEADLRNHLVDEILLEHGKGVFMQGPIFFHYGKHTKMGDRVFINYDFTVQDDAMVTIGSDVNFGPKCTIVTPVHPMIASERNAMRTASGEVKRLCYAKPVTIGNSVWFGANVTVCGGVTIGDGCVIGAGSVVVKDIPAGCFAAGNPARVIREITEKDSMKYKPEILADNEVIE